MYIKRMWINQPSTLQPFHKLHGQRVLAEYETSEDKDLHNTTVIVYFTDPELDVWKSIPTIALSEGWKV
jgi:hypothetical protein